MTVFFSDLDNTAIYSHRHTIEDSVVWIETLHGKKQSFMTKKYYEYFVHQNWLKVVPVTTRTYEQYKRLEKVAKDLRWKDALICNGSILLRDGIEDVAWRDESILISQSDQSAFQELLTKTGQLWQAEAIISVPEIMFYIKVDGGVDEAFEQLREFADPEHICIYRDSKKVYCLPASLSKGNAVKRYMKMQQDMVSIAAGDSEFDISMLEQADFCLCPEKISDQIKETEKKMICRGIFSDEICNKIERLRKERNLGN